MVVEARHSGTIPARAGADRVTGLSIGLAGGIGESGLRGEAAA
jgi:hypothetical protein